MARTRGRAGTTGMSLEERLRAFAWELSSWLDVGAAPAFLYVLATGDSLRAARIWSLRVLRIDECWNTSRFRALISPSPAVTPGSSAGHGIHPVRVLSVRPSSKSGPTWTPSLPTRPSSRLTRRNSTQRCSLLSTGGSSGEMRARPRPGHPRSRTSSEQHLAAHCSTLDAATSRRPTVSGGGAAPVTGLAMTTRCDGWRQACRRAKRPDTSTQHWVGAFAHAGVARREPDDRPVSCPGYRRWRGCAPHAAPGLLSSRSSGWPIMRARPSSSSPGVKYAADRSAWRRGPAAARSSRARRERSGWCRRRRAGPPCHDSGH